MNINFFNDCYNVIALSTCVLGNNNDNWMFGTTNQINLTDSLSATTKYESLCSDSISPYDYEIHYFSIDFFRNGQLIDELSFERKINESSLGSLANPELSIEDKLSAISNLKPSLRSNIKAMSKLASFSQEEINAVLSKSKELEEHELSLTQNQGKAK